MKITSLNGWLKQTNITGYQVVGSWFCIVSVEDGVPTAVYYNQDGREVFRAIDPIQSLSWWKRFGKWIMSGNRFKGE